MKGDYIEVLTSTGSGVVPVRLEATKAGRTVTAKYGAKWLDVAEVSRPTAANPKGRSVGNSLRVRIEAVVSVEERRQEDPEAKQPRARAKAATPEPLGL